MSKKWERQYQFYHSLFPDIPTITSPELVQKYRDLFFVDDGAESDMSEECFITANNCEDCCSLILIDVRSQPERSVSCIPSAISLEQYESGIKAGTIPLNANIITYCTVGYRSGVEARRLCDRYDHVPGKICSLDGIVAYTHAANAKHLVSGHSGQETNRVHTFGSMWGHVGNDYQATSFGIGTLMYRNLEVMGRTVAIFLSRCFMCKEC
mmetsp:Transcript_21718/g.32444  ORF Transcript_21718/g.32444 Transcript_21718/m.32444 type:complete len:210 (-) Transcript_21718:107-736(-)